MFGPVPFTASVMVLPGRERHAGAHVDHRLRKLQAEDIALDQFENQRLDDLPGLQRRSRRSERAREREAGRQVDRVHEAFLAAVDFPSRIDPQGEAFVNASETISRIVPKKPAPHLMRGGIRFLDKTSRQTISHQLATRPAQQVPACDAYFSKLRTAMLPSSIRMMWPRLRSSVRYKSQCTLLDGFMMPPNVIVPVQSASNV